MVTKQIVSQIPQNALKPSGRLCWCAGCFVLLFFVFFVVSMLIPAFITQVSMFRLGGIFLLSSTAPGSI